MDKELHQNYARLQRYYIDFCKTVDETKYDKNSEMENWFDEHWYNVQFCVENLADYLEEELSELVINYA